MNVCLYNTSPDWVEFLRGRGVRDNVNFWRKDTRKLGLTPGTPFYFKERGAQRVVGRGFFREIVNLAAGEAWTRFEVGNGSASPKDFYRRMQEALEIEAVTDGTVVSCIVLDGLEWLPSRVALPPGFFPQGILGAKFYEEEEVAFISSEFFTDPQPGAAISPLVLVQAKPTAGGQFNDRDDLADEQYHFPDQYREHLVPGRRFIYCRVVRGQAEYFGHGRIGTVWLDETTADRPRESDRAWFCAVEDYVEFPTPLAANQQGRYFEDIRRDRDWQVVVRPIIESTYRDILAAAGLAQVAPGPPILAHVELQSATNLLRPRRAPRNATAKNPPRSFRRSKRAAAVGRRAEQLVLARLQTRFANVRWLSELRELPGYDIEYEDQGVRHAVEVKGTTGSYFPAIELTINEWLAAERFRERFWLYLVANCEGTTPLVEVIRNPASLKLAGQADLSPILFRFELRQKLD